MWDYHCKRGLAYMGFSLFEWGTVSWYVCMHACMHAWMHGVSCHWRSVMCLGMMMPPRLLLKLTAWAMPRLKGQRLCLPKGLGQAWFVPELHLEASTPWLGSLAGDDQGSRRAAAQLGFKLDKQLSQCWTAGAAMMLLQSLCTWAALGNAHMPHFV